MPDEFTAIVRALVAEQGKAALVDPAKCKAFLPDYAKECRLLQRVVEAGVAKEIDAAANLDICKKQQVRHLKEDLFMAEDVAASAVDLLAFALRGDTGRPVLEAPKPAPQKPEEVPIAVPEPVPQKPVTPLPELKSFFENVPSPVPAVVSTPDESKDMPPKYYHSSLPERIFCTVIGLIPIGICLFLLCGFLLYSVVPIWQTFAPQWCPCFMLFLLSQSRQPASSAWCALSLHLALDSLQKCPDYVILAVL